MLAEAFPRLAIRLRSTFPDAQIKLKHLDVSGSCGLQVSFPAFPSWEVEVSGTPCHAQFQLLQSKIVLRYDCLQNVPEDDFMRLVAAENLGLRGVSIIADRENGRRTLTIRSTFVAQKGRTRDEAENLAIDTLSLLRFARLLEDRIMRSTVGDQFSYEMYYSQYLSKSIGRNRFINYARSVFQGSTERVFGQVLGMLKEDYKYRVTMNRPFVATIQQPDAKFEIVIRIPEEIPMITVCAPLQACGWSPNQSFELVSRLNAQIQTGHFEVNPDGSLISYVAWKHLTNDLRYYSLDQLIVSVHDAQSFLFSQLPEQKANAAELLKANATSLNAYRGAA